MLVLLALGVWYLYRPAVQRQVLERIIPRVEEYLGREIRVGSIHYNLFPLWLELRDVSVGGPRPGDRPIITARRVYVLAELRRVFQRPVIELQEVRAEGVEVFVHRFADNTDNWPRPRRRGPRRERPYELDITSFTVADGLFRFEDEAVKVDLTASHIRVALLGMGGTDVQGRVVAEQVDLQLPRANAYRAAVSGKVAVHREGLEILVARAASPEATLRGTGLVVWKGEKRVDLDVSGSVSADVFQKLGYIDDQVDGWFQVDGKFGWKPGIWGFRGETRSSRLRALDWELSDVAGSVVGDRNAIWADIDRARYAGGDVRGWVEVTLPQGPRRDRGQRNTRLELRLAGVDAERFLDDSRIPVGDLASTLSGVLEYRFAETDWRHGSGVGELEVAAQPRQDHGLPLAGVVPFVVDRGRVESEGVRLEAPGQVVTAAMRYDIATETGAIDYLVESSDLGPLAQAIPVSPAADGGAPLWLPTVGRGELSGTLQLAPRHVATELRLALLDAKARGLAADRADGLVALSGGGVERLQLELSRGASAALIAGTIPYAKGSPWSLDLDLAAWPAEDAAPWLPFPLPVTGPFTGSVTIAAEGASTSGSLSGEAVPATVFDVPLSALRADLKWDDAAMQVGELVLTAPAGEIALAGTMAFPGHELALSVAASGLDLAREPFAGLGGGLAGRASFAGELGGTLEHPGLAGDLVAEGLTLDGRPLGEDGRAVLRVDWGGDQLRAQGSLLGLAQLSGGGFLDLDRMDLTFAVEVAELAALAALGPEGLPEIAGSAGGELRAAGPLEAPDLALRLDRLATTVGGTPLHAGEPVLLRLSDGRLWIDSLYLLDDDGSSEVIAAGSAGLAEGEPLDLRLQATVDNAWLGPWLPGFQLTGTSDVLATVRGTVGAARLNGQAAVRPGARLTSEALPQPIEDVDAVVLFYPDRLVVDTFTGSMGGGRVQASGGLEWPGEGEPIDARFQLGVRQVSLRWPEGWLLRGDGDLVWTVTGEDQLLRGLVTLDRALYLRDVDLGLVQLLERFFRHARQEVGSADEKLDAVQLNLQVRAPAGTVRIRNNLADLRASAELTVRGTVARPLVFGEVETEPGGRLVYADNEYRVERGTLTFANPYRIEPLLDLEATTRVAQYDVRLSLFGGLDRLNATFSSDPPLPDLEVLSLLLSGSRARWDDDLQAQVERPDEVSSTAGAEGLLLGQAASLVTERVSSLFGFDAFRVEPMSRSGESVSSARLTVGKRVSSDVYVTYSYDPSSTGGQRLQVEWQVAEGFLVLLTQEQDSYAVDMVWERRF